VSSYDTKTKLLAEPRLGLSRKQRTETSSQKGSEFTRLLNDFLITVVRKDSDNSNRGYYYCQTLFTVAIVVFWWEKGYGFIGQNDSDGL
jgi:hypothetical protein